MSDFSIAFIGAGNMAGSIIGGMLAAGVSADRFSASDPATGNLDALRERGLTNLGSDNKTAVTNADVVVLAVKPQVLAEVCADIAPVVNADKLVISIAAGVEGEAIDRWLGGYAAIVRCMPNTPALVGEGASALCPIGDVSDQHRSWAEEILGAVGVVRWVGREHDLHAVTAVSGSGPAYFFQFMEAMIAEAERMGLDAETARTLCAQTCIGAGHMVAAGDVDAGELRRRVCSPGGTTERAVAAFSAGDLAGLVSTAMEDCFKRSEELAEELSR